MVLRYNSRFRNFHKLPSLIKYNHTVAMPDMNRACCGTYNLRNMSRSERDNTLYNKATMYGIYPRNTLPSSNYSLNDITNFFDVSFIEFKKRLRRNKW